MHKKLLAEQFKGEIEIKKDIEGTDMKYMIVEDGENYKVKIFEGDNNNDRQFSWEKVEIEPRF